MLIQKYTVITTCVVPSPIGILTFLMKLNRYLLVQIVHSHKVLRSSRASIIKSYGAAKILLPLLWFVMRIETRSNTTDAPCLVWCPQIRGSPVIRSEKIEGETTHRVIMVANALGVRLKTETQFSKSQYCRFIGRKYRFYSCERITVCDEMRKIRKSRLITNRPTTLRACKGRRKLQTNLEISRYDQAAEAKTRIRQV